MNATIHDYGRMLEDFAVGETYAHPWEVTVDAGAVALFQANFLDATPTYASARYAKDLGLEGRPIHPLLLLNYGLSFSVHDVSEQAIAHLAYIGVRFPEACYVGETLTATSKVLSAKATSAGDRGVVHVATVLRGEGDKVVCAFERKALVRAGKLTTRPDPGFGPVRELPVPEDRLPAAMRDRLAMPQRNFGFAGFAEDFEPGRVFVHACGKTVEGAEHQQLTFLVRNTHPLHFDEVYCKAGASFAGTRVVYGGLVLSWVATLASRDTLGNAVWDLGLDNGAHPNGVVAGDTLFAASKVIAREPHDAKSSKVTFRLVGTKNVRADVLLAQGADLFTSELAKKDGKVKEKVVEIDRTVLVKNRRA
ncbi:MAG: MaoC family dehydratase [Polyangiaceae bacterium]